jgi:type IV pilus assembly protein PilA
VQTLKNLAGRRQDDEEGFTLIELMVVVLIIAILIAIAIPTFLGARQRAQDRAAQSDLRNALTTEKTVYTDSQTYSACSAAACVTAATPNMVDAEASLNWNGTKSATRPLNVTVGQNTVVQDTVCLSEQSASGSWFAIGDIATTAAGKPAAGTFFDKAAADPCANPASAATIATWASSF